MVHRAASRLPRLSDRYREEWTADLADIPGHMMKVLYAVDLLVGLRRLRRELLREKSTDVTVELRGVSATASIGTVGTWVVPPPDLQIHVPAESLSLADTPQIVISTAVPSTMAAIHEGWESTSSSSGYNPRHYGRNLRHHPAYGTTISQVILPLEGTKNEST